MKTNLKSLTEKEFNKFWESEKEDKEYGICYIQLLWEDIWRNITKSIVYLKFKYPDIDVQEVLDDLAYNCLQDYMNY